MAEKAIALLAALGVAAAESDPLLAFLVQSVTEWILNVTHQDAVPEGLYHFGARQVVGQYLRTLKNSGKLEGFDLEAAVQQIQEGDTSVTFGIGQGSMTPEARLEALIAYLCDSGREALYRYRRLVW